MGIMCEDLPKKSNHKELKIAVCKAVDSYDDGDIITPEMLQKKVISFYPDANKTFLETIMRYVRKYRRENVICFDKRNSLYRKHSVI